MECRPMEIRLLSASGIKNVNRFTKMDVFALVLVAGDPRSRQRSPTDRRCGTCPNWNFSLRFTLDESAFIGGHLTLIFQLRSERFLGDKDIGHLHIPLIQLFRPDNNLNVNNFKEHRLVSFNLTTSNGKQKGTINFSYSFGTKFKMSLKLPPQLPPPLPLGSGSSAAAPPTAYRFPTYPSRFAAPPGTYDGVHGNAAPPATMQQQPVREKNGRNNFEMGLGAGMLGMGGLLIWSDHAFDSGFDHGIDPMDSDMGTDF